MTLAPVQGKTGSLKVGASDNVVGGVRNLGVPKTWNTEDTMHLGDNAPSTLLNYQNWEVPVSLTLDHTDDGQGIMFAASEAGTSLAFKAYVTNTNYWEGTGVITDWRETIDAQKVNTATCTIKPYLGSMLNYT